MGIPSQPRFPSPVNLGAALLLIGSAMLLAACESSIAFEPLPLGTPGARDPSHLGAADPNIRFEQGALVFDEEVRLVNPTSLAFGPDGRLYVAEMGGRILAISLAGQTVTDVEVIATADDLANVLGIAFNPADPPEPVTMYVSQTSVFAGPDAPPYPGKVSKLVAPAFEPEDIITGLPVSVKEHATNGIAFDSEGRLYIAQGGVTDAGIVADPGREETPLSAAILVAEIDKPDFDGRVRYDPPDEVSATVDQAGGNVRVYAPGLRNPYDLLVHSNGRIYATDNGPNGRIPLIACAEGPPHNTAPDELNLVLEGRYYGHPNRNRARFDERQCTYRSPEDAAGGNTPPLATLGYYTSSNGLAEYTSDTFGGSMKGDLLYVEWAKGRVWRVQLSDGGRKVGTISPLLPESLQRPLDITVGPDGSVYIAEFGGDRIVYLTPAAEASSTP